MRVHWRRVRVGTVHEKADRDHNERLAEAVLTDPVTDCVAVALDLCGWQIAPRDGRPEPWPLHQNSALVPDWCISITAQETAISRAASRSSA
jgi:hypothetical protein